MTERARIPVTDEAERVRLILSDVVMHGMGGRALLLALRAQGGHKPVILLTGHALDSEIENHRLQGLTTWLTKPPRLEQLAGAIADALRSGRRV